MTRKQYYRLTDAGVKVITKQSTPTKATRHDDGTNLYLASKWIVILADDLPLTI